MLIMKRYGEPVELHLTTYLERLPLQAIADTLVELLHLCFAIGVGQREHRPLMNHLTELA